ncbi:MAG TPA: pyridoxal-phosphate dependent enzyme [Thermoanaerobaculia bacterium]|nr:pyridoxal-phosphate dependent enzyme [Thermoanaerobaculia bacterium]
MDAAPIDVARAAERLAPYAAPTPLVQSLLLSRELDCELWVKNETVSPIASFKWRGALNAILGSHAPVVTSSTVNHGQGVAWAARVAGVAAHVFLPRGANPIKRAKIELLGATIHDAGDDLDDAKAQALAFARGQGLRFIDDGESAAVIAGAGTVGFEIARQLRDIDVVYVPMGSGSLASGVAMAMPGARVIAVQAKGSPAMVESFHARRAIERPIDTIADGLVCRVPAQLALDALIAHVADAVTCSDEELLTAARRMILGAHILVEPSGAAGLAAALRDDVRGKRVVVIATGSNITAEVFAKLHA